MHRSPLIVFGLTIGLLSFFICPLHAAEPVWTWQNPQPTGSTLRSVTFLDQSNVVAVGDGGTILRSADAGLTWSDIDTRTTYYLHDVAFGTATDGLVVGSRGIMLKTSDGGANWTSITSPTTNELTAVRSLDAMTYFATDSWYLMRSLDGGGTWQKRVFPPDFSSVHFWPFDTNRVIAVGGLVTLDGGYWTAAVLLSTDAGVTWTSQYVGPYQTDLRAVSFSDAANGTATGQPGTVIRTTDGGVTWTLQPAPTKQILESVVQLDSTRAIAVGYGGRIIFTSNGGTSWNASVSNTDRALHGIASNGSITLAVGDNGIILRSMDGGASWGRVSSGFTYGRICGVHFVDNLQGTVVGDNGAIYRTEDGGVSWTPQSSGITSRLRGVYFTDRDHGHAVGSDGYIIRTSDGGATWIRRSRDTNLDLYSVSFDGPDTGYIAGWNKVYKTSDGGITWVSQTNAPLSLYTDVCARDGAATVVGWVQNFIRTTDGGATWLQRAFPWRETYNAVFFLDANTGIVVGDYGTIVRTTDGGATWTRVLTGTGRSLNDVWFGDALTGTAVGEWGDVRFTTDGGLTWKWQRSGLEASYLGDIFGVCMTGPDTGTMVGSGGAILRREPEQPIAVLITSFAGRVTSKGVDLMWSLQTDEPVRSIELSRKEGEPAGYRIFHLDSQARAFLDTTARPGVRYVYTLDALTDAGSFRSAPVELSMPALEAQLLQNTPNPFNPITTIAYVIPVTSAVTLRVYSPDGSLVRTLVNGTIQPGAQEATWDGRNDFGQPVASGVYFYRLDTGKTTLSRKMVLLK